MIAAVASKIAAAATISALSGTGWGGGGIPGGITSAAMQQGGLGMLMTVMLITVPPMAATFFQGAVAGGFSAYSQFGVNRPHDPNTTAGRAAMGSHGPPVGQGRADGSGINQGGGGRVASDGYNAPTNTHGDRPPSSAIAQGDGTR